MNKRYVGIMVSHSLYKGILTGNTKHEVIPYYEEAGLSYGLTPCYFRLRDINREENRVKAYIKSAKGYSKHWIPIPNVIHNRTYFLKKRFKERIQRLESDGKQIFNQWNRYGKLYIYDLLMMDNALRPHLPCTVPATTDSTIQLMSMFDSLIIKPNIGSIGRGILKLDRIDSDEWKLTYPRDKRGKSWGSLKLRDKLPHLLLKRFDVTPYVIQQRLPLATYKGRPFDLRVSVQKDDTGNWQVTGIAGKVAASHKFITNVAQGGSVISLENLLREFPQLNFSAVREAICGFSLQVVHHLSQHLPHIADVGLDVGITEFGYPVFIECNNRDLRYSFSKANMIKEWKATYRNPVGYARYLLENQ